MEGALNHYTSKRSLVDEDANISTFRRTNKIIILVLIFLIISLTLIIAAVITQVVRIHTHTKRVRIPPIDLFCALSHSDAELCLKTINPIISGRFVDDPNQILTISLESAANDLLNITSLVLLDSGSADFAFKRCSDSLKRGFSRISGAIAMMRINPFVESLSMEQRGETRNRIVAAKGDVESCVGYLAKDESVAAAAGAVTAKLVEVSVYLNAAVDFLSGYVKVFEVYEILEIHEGIIYENLYAICMRGLQVLFMIGMFCVLFRIR